jgi:uracil-DNA glycosylase
VGAGNLNSSLMIIGEGPGQEEDRQGLPFVGRSGALLDEALVAAGTSRDLVYITNIVKCRPPGNRDPSPEEIFTCSSFLDLQIKDISPKVILTLGRISASNLFGRPIKITKERGAFHFLDSGIRIYPAFHPAYVLRNRKTEIEKLFFQDIRDAWRIANEKIKRIATNKSPLESIR